MEDNTIIQLFFERSETAITETAAKYGKLCHTIAYNILYNEEDSEECVNDTYMKAWEVIPPQIPEKLAAFLGKITRNLAISKYRHNSSLKRGGGQVAYALEELAECIPDKNTTEQAISDKLFVEQLNGFLEKLPVEKRKVFMQRYWYLRPISEIAEEFSMSESKVKMILHRTRNSLKEVLEKEGIVL
ncbi:MAG: sigma-70 family RNA polymerase sigma factor [Lachnospiraceae bacterium]|nr:sigma-70 family RNA polymerase sigma factor [Lachnospiraceae bacterium]